MKKTFVILFFISTFCHTIFSQDITLRCGEKEIECQNGNKSHFEMIMNCPFEETDTFHLPRKIKVNAKKYLVERVGINFYNKLKYYSCQSVDFDKFNEIKKQKPWISEDSDHRIKYSIQYYFRIQDSMRYYMSIVFDKDGNILSNHQLPDYRKNEKFDNIVSVCDIISKAEQDQVFPGDFENVSLEYADSVNIFVWKVEKQSIPEKKSREKIHRFILFNANSGQILKRESEAWTSVGEGNSF